MADRPYLADLDPDDAATADALAAAFAPVTLDRPVPRTAPSPAAPQVARPPHRTGGRAGRRLLGAAAAVVVLAAAVSLLPGRGAVAWAAEPDAATPGDVAAAAQACGAPLARGVGDLEQSGSASVDGGPAPAAPAAPASAPAAPRSLPPLAVLDVRGDGALAVYQDATWQVVCLLRRENGVWVDQGLSVGPGPSTATPGVLAGGRTAWAGGESVSYVGGSVPAGTTAVAFRLDDGTTVRASLLGTTFAAWFPGDREVVPGSVTTSR